MVRGKSISQPNVSFFFRGLNWFWPWIVTFDRVNTINISSFICFPTQAHHPTKVGTSQNTVLLGPGGHCTTHFARRHIIYGTPQNTAPIGPDGHIILHIFVRKIHSSWTGVSRLAYTFSQNSAVKGGIHRADIFQTGHQDYGTLSVTFGGLF